MFLLLISFPKPFRSKLGALELAAMSLKATGTCE
jgi:hypothetical protein